MCQIRVINNNVLLIHQLSLQIIFENHVKDFFEGVSIRMSI